MIEVRCAGNFFVAASRNIWSGAKFRNDVVRHSQAQLDECFTLAFYFSLQYPDASPRHVHGLRKHHPHLREGLFGCAQNRRG